MLQMAVLKKQILAKEILSFVIFLFQIKRKTDNEVVFYHSLKNEY
jgi:hypothetical protein